MSLMSLRLFALGLFSAALLLIELGFTRLFATRYYPPFVFVILSVAILGLGVGAALVTVGATLRRPERLPRYTAGAALCTLLVIGAVGIIEQTTLLLFLATLPFLCAGLVLATIFSHHVNRSTQLYFADLLGAGIGALLALPLFGWLGLIQGMALAVMMLVAAAILFQSYADSALPTGDSPIDVEGTAKLSFSGGRKGWGRVANLLLLIIIGAIALIGTRWWQPSPQQLFPNKPITQRLTTGGTVIDTVWDSFARTDLVAPADDLPYELYMDGAAGSVMPPAAGHPALWRDIGFFPFATEQPERVFVIGPGGGLDIWFGLQSGAAEIVAVEVNPASIALLQEYGSYNGGLATADGVRLVAGEGRSVLRREGHFYDLIFLSQVVTLAAERSGYALVENHAYTVEAFATYLNHLRPGGILALKLYDEPTLTRALTTALAALEQRGFNERAALAHILVLVDPSHEPAIPLLMIRNEPFSRDDALSLGAVANDVGFRPLFLPGAWAEAPFDAVVAGETTFAAIVANAPESLTPTTDNRPFFFLFERGLPQQLRQLLWLIGLLFAGSLIVPDLIQRFRRGQAAEQPLMRPLPITFPLYFGALGVGFMLIEITLIQQTQRFLEHPTTAVAVVLATLLVGAGLGSMISGYWVKRHSSTTLPRWPLVGILLSFALWLLLWPQLSAYFLPFARYWRLATVIVYLLPLALFMGMPFPLGLRLVGQKDRWPVALAWTVNGVASVAGTLLALAGAIVWGYHAVALGGWLCYLGAFLWVTFTKR